MCVCVKKGGGWGERQREREREEREKERERERERWWVKECKIQKPSVHILEEKSSRITGKSFIFCPTCGNHRHHSHLHRCHQSWRETRETTAASDCDLLAVYRVVVIDENGGCGMDDLLTARKEVSLSRVKKQPNEKHDGLDEGLTCPIETATTF